MTNSKENYRHTEFKIGFPKKLQLLKIISPVSLTSMESERKEELHVFFTIFLGKISMELVTYRLNQSRGRFSISKNPNFLCILCWSNLFATPRLKALFLAKLYSVVWTVNFDPLYFFCRQNQLPGLFLCHT